MTAPSLSDAAWLTDPATRAVMAALAARGGPDAARFVGGCVRNSLLDRPVDDVDIATRLEPHEVMEALKTAGLKAVPTGLDHGTVTAVSDHRPFEITTLRRDVTTDGRRATVAFTGDWAEDAGRRDFHINALYADTEGQVFDPTGQGLADIAARRVAFVGDPDRRIREDRLRILRFFRFQAWYGRGVPDPAGLAACVREAEGLSELSAERVSKELLKLLAAPNPVPTVAIMAETGILQRLLPEVPGLEAFQGVAKVSDDAVLRLSALMPLDVGARDRAARALRLSNRDRVRLVALAGPVPDLEQLGEAAVRAMVYADGRQATQDRLTLALAARPGQVERHRTLNKLVETWPIPRMPVGGREVAAMGVPPGPETGALLAAFEAGWIADDFPADGHAERLRALIDQRPG
ncbi:CCA tRNA nucleotidyltransferase [Brevundimonas poindexterae]|uniref:CCA tRNA nucleotidyltransferase n=1 Tax=Brevundimonas poindexterae TaxID=74325 RepID=UPI001CFD11CB|nr:CCA tRNA nucleotidyltransferase [Brevundimonas poindexterae]